MVTHNCGQCYVKYSCVQCASGAEKSVLWRGIHRRSVRSRPAEVRGRGMVSGKGGAVVLNDFRGGGAVVSSDLRRGRGSGLK